MIGTLRLYAIDSEKSVKRFVSWQFWRRPLPLALAGVVALLIITCISGTIYLGLAVANYRSHTVRYVGPSMEPTIHDGQYLTIQSYGKANPKRFDIVILHPPYDPSTLNVKRIIGVPGEVVVVTGAAVTINGKPLAEPYLPPQSAGTVGDSSQSQGHYELTLQKDEYYVLGDNRADSLDSRDFGAISRSAITAKVVAINK